MHAMLLSKIWIIKEVFNRSCKHSDISTFSFHPLKTITTGEGGLVTTNKEKFQKKLKN